MIRKQFKDCINPRGPNGRDLSILYVWLVKQNKIPLGAKSTLDKSALLIYDIKMTNVWRHLEVGTKLGAITAVGRSSHYCDRSRGTNSGRN